MIWETMKRELFNKTMLMLLAAIFCLFYVFPRIYAPETLAMVDIVDPTIIHTKKRWFLPEIETRWQWRKPNAGPEQYDHPVWCAQGTDGKWYPGVYGPEEYLDY